MSDYNKKMSRKLLFLFVALVLFGCKGSAGEKFFDYDQIDYYYNDVSDSILSAFPDKGATSDLDSLKSVVIAGHTPESLSDLYFIDKMSKIGYHKTLIDTNKFKAIDKIFMQQKSSQIDEAACVPVYRDILVFKKHGNVVGIAKICFSCSQNEIHGGKVSTKYFGQDGDYERLEQLIRTTH